MRTGTPRRLLLAFALLLPIIEVVVAFQVGRVLGAMSTVALLVALSIAGGWVIRHQGRQTLRDLQSSSRQGRPTERAIADRGLVFIGGVLLLAPGFVTAVLSIGFFVPLSRTLLRHALAEWVARHHLASSASTGAGPDGGPHVVRGEVIDDF